MIVIITLSKGRVCRYCCVYCAASDTTKRRNSHPAHKRSVKIVSKLLTDLPGGWIHNHITCGEIVVSKQVLKLRVIFQTETNVFVARALHPRPIAKDLSSKTPSDFVLEGQKFTNQHPGFTLHLRKTKEFHDRFVIVDRKKCYLLGASIKNAGNKGFTIVPLEDLNIIQFIMLGAPLFSRTEQTNSTGYP